MSNCEHSLTIYLKCLSLAIFFCVLVGCSEGTSSELNRSAEGSSTVDNVAFAGDESLPGEESSIGADLDLSGPADSLNANSDATDDLDSTNELMGVFEPDPVDVNSSVTINSIADAENSEPSTQEQISVPITDTGSASDTLDSTDELALIADSDSANDPVQAVEEVLAQPDTGTDNLVLQTDLSAEPSHCAPENSSLDDRLISYLDTDHHELLAALEVPHESPAEVDENDLVLTRTDLVRPGTIKLVVKKPNLVGSVYEIGDFPDDAVEAFRFLQDEFENALESEASIVQFPEQAHIRIANHNPAGAHIPFEDFSDVVIDLNGSTIEFMNIAPGMVIKNSQRVVFKNGRFTTSHLISSIAKVEQDDSTPAKIKFTLLPEFAAGLKSQYESTGTKPTVYTIGRAEQNQSGDWRFAARGSSDLFTNRSGNENKYVYRENGSSDNVDVFFSGIEDGTYQTDYKPGDFVYLLHQNNNGTGIILKNTDADVEDISFINLTLSNIPGMAIFGEVNRGLHVDSVNIIPDSSNPTSIWGSSSDAFHINNTMGDVLVENSNFGASADDLLTIRSNWWAVSNIGFDNNNVRVTNADRSYGVHLWAMEGHRLVVIDRSLNVLGGTTHRSTSFRDSGKRHDLYLESLPDALAMEDILVANPDVSPSRIVVRDNTFSTSRAQGVLVQAANMVVENNHFENIAGPAVKLNFALSDWYEGVSVRNIVIDNNTYKDTAVGSSKPPYTIYFNQFDGNQNSVNLITDVKISRNQVVCE